MITEGEQVREDSDAMGPSSELKHWKREEARLGNLLQQIRDPKTKISELINALTAIRPRRVKV